MNWKFDFSPLTRDLYRERHPRSAVRAFQKIALLFCFHLHDLPVPAKSAPATHQHTHNSKTPESVENDARIGSDSHGGRLFVVVRVVDSRGGGRRKSGRRRLRLAVDVRPGIRVPGPSGDGCVGSAGAGQRAGHGAGKPLSDHARLDESAAAAPDLARRILSRRCQHSRDFPRAHRWSNAA